MTSFRRRKLPNSLFEADGRCILVTGAAGGVGRAVVDAFCKAGAAVVATDLVAPSQTEGATWIEADLTSEADVADLFARAGALAGRIDHVVHCAGAVGRGPLVTVTLADWRQGLDVNLTSAFLIARAAHPWLVGSRGSLVLMSSPNGVHGGTVLSGPAYATAKAGVLNLTRYLAKEWAADRVRVNCVVPGTVDTPMLARLEPEALAAVVASIPLGRLVQPDEVASSVLYLCSEHARSMTGATINVSGGRLLS